MIHSFFKNKIFFISLLLVLITHPVFGNNKISLVPFSKNSETYLNFDKTSYHQFIQQQREDSDRWAYSYLISGAVMTLGGVWGYYASQETLAKSLYVVTQSVGVATVGYGLRHLWLGPEHNSFYQTLLDSSLSEVEKNNLFRKYLKIEAERKEREKWVKTGTHALISAIHFYSAHREEQNEIKNLFYFLGTANLFLALNFSW